MLKIRAKRGSPVTLHHVYSHVQDKLNQRDADLAYRICKQMYELDFDFGNCEDIYKGNVTADELDYQATKTSMIRYPFPTSSKILFTR